MSNAVQNQIGAVVSSTTGAASPSSAKGQGVPAGFSGDCSGEFALLAEKALARLRPEGACLVFGSLTPGGDGDGLAEGFAAGLELVSGRPVLLVDTGEPAGAAGHPGLTEVLRGGATLAMAARSGIRPGLRVVARGGRESDDGELLASAAFREFLQDARRQFAWVVLHCPDLLEGGGAPMISRADAVIATLKRGEGRARDVQALREMCGQLKTEFLGVALV